MTTTHMIDQAPRQDCNPDGHAAKLARARAYLKERNIEAVAPGNQLTYTRSERGSRVLRHLLRRAA